jgi:CHAT domain-containing protein
MGDITGEGVFGLQRAFKQAGAQTIVMSLWSVNDKATRLLMAEFYKNLLTCHQSKHKALIIAQRRMRQHPKYSSPYYWAGFIVID